MSLRVEPLVGICGQLGIPVADLHRVEDASELTLETDISGDNAASLTFAAARAAVDEYGSAVRIGIYTDELPELVIDPQVAESTLQEFVTRVRPEDRFVARIHLDKRPLVSRLTPAGALRTVQLFLFAAGLRRSLARGITRFEAEVWPDAPAPLVIMIADTAAYLDGPYLSILGSDHMDILPTVVAVPAPARDFAAVQEARDRHIDWSVPWTQSLTPWHFDVTGECADAALAQMLRAQLAKLSILFTCDRARSLPNSGTPEVILAEYRGREHLATIPIDESRGTPVGDDEAQSLIDLCSWCYSGVGYVNESTWVSDRLPFIQARFAEMLEPRTDAVRLTILVGSLPNVLEGLRWQWKAFIEGKVGEYLTQVQQVETAVSDTASGFADRSASLTKTVSDTILAAVAVLIGSFIAAAFKDPFNATVFRIGMIAYAGYVLIFPGIIGLLATYQGLEIAQASFDARISRFKEVLPQQKVDQIADQRVKRARCTFFRWLGVAALVYVLVATAALVSAAVVPEHVGDTTPVEKPTGTTPPATAVVEPPATR